MIDTVSLLYRLSDRQLAGLLGDWKPDSGSGNLGCGLPLHQYSVSGDQAIGVTETWSGKSDEDGWTSVQRCRGVNTLKVERSLPKWLSKDAPCRVLSAAEAQDGLRAYDNRIRELVPQLLWTPAEISRLDIYYQHEVGDSRGVIQKCRGGAANETRAAIGYVGYNADDSRSAAGIPDV